MHTLNDKYNDIMCLLLIITTCVGATKIKITTLKYMRLMHVNGGSYENLLVPDQSTGWNQVNIADKSCSSCR